MRRIYALWVICSCFFTFFCVNGAVFAERDAAGTPSNEVRTESETPLSVNRKNRPPRPSGELEENRFPPGFLTLSTSTEEPREPPANEPAEEKKTPEEDKISGENSDMLLASVVGIGLLTLFFWSHYRHRAWLEKVLARNRQVLSGEDLSDDVGDFALPALPLFAGVGVGTSAASLAGFSTETLPLSEHLGADDAESDYKYQEWGQ